MSKKAGTFKIQENWRIRTVDSYTGKILSNEEFCNTIVNDGLERTARLLIGNSSTYYRALAIGTGIISVSPTDTQLAIEYDRQLASLSYVSDYQAQFNYTFTFGSGVSTTITEAGIFDSAIVSGSSMLARVTFPGKDVNHAVSLIITATITISRN